MSVLDLQNLKETSDTGDERKPPSGSRASKGCGGGGGSVDFSGLSLLLC